MKRIVSRIAAGAMLAMGLVAVESAPAMAHDFHSCYMILDNGFSCAKRREGSNYYLWLGFNGNLVGKVRYNQADGWLTVIDCRADGTGIQARADTGSFVELFTDRNGSRGATCSSSVGEVGVESYRARAVWKFRAKWGYHGTGWVVVDWS